MWGRLCGDINPRHVGVEKNPLQCESCGENDVVTSAPVMLAVKRINYNVNNVGEVIW